MVQLRTTSTRPPGRLAFAMRALGRADLPSLIDVAGIPFQRQQTIKHDFFAATGFYQAADGRLAVLKMGRTISFFGFPMSWIGRWLCRREVAFYHRLHDLLNVPKIFGMVGHTGFVHEYVPGRPLSKDRPVPDGFFPALQQLLAELHRRNIAYVDTNKPENILLGDDQLPHLIDFQISFWVNSPARHPFRRWWLHRLQRADIYHILKHKKRLRKDQLTSEEAQIVAHRGFLIQLHRIVFKPYFVIRRRLFKWLRGTGRILPEGSK